MAMLKTQSVLITGANKGIGLELVKQLINSPVPPAQILATFWQSSSTQVKARDNFCQLVGSIGAAMRMDRAESDGRLLADGGGCGFSWRFEAAVATRASSWCLQLATAKLLQQLETVATAAAAGSSGWWPWQGDICSRNGTRCCGGLTEAPSCNRPKARIPGIDVTDSASIRRAVDRVEAILGNSGLNLLINNAGINSHVTLETVTAEDMMMVYQTNVVGPLLVVQAFLPLLKKAAQTLDMEKMSCNKAAIVNITSLLGSITLSQKNFGRAPMYPYRLSKVALNMVSMCLSEDLKQYQIISVAVHPGWVQTDMGGEEAPMSVSDSVSNLMKLFASLSQCDTGKFLDLEGRELPW
ncbi:uncharacterized protein LOC132830248 [Hemiscyllium ocellatum]|uniref:uncharacterized protein LOC132830248 n=1 Tax=Hemiscyllium ocellatum TaxID=170820 RepID=UPI00296628B1|nr:uncharacterized protein LOC132830248 [Hemiscyllium ocellatum]